MKIQVSALMPYSGYSIYFSSLPHLPFLPPILAQIFPVAHPFIFTGLYVNSRTKNTSESSRSPEEINPLDSCSLRFPLTGFYRTVACLYFVLFAYHSLASFVTSSPPDAFHFSTNSSNLSMEYSPVIIFVAYSI